MSETLDAPQPREPESQLPIDPLGLALRLLSRLPILAVALLGSLAVGYMLGIRLGQRTYIAETILLYRPVKAGSESLNVQTQLNLIKTQANLEETRKRLGLKSSTEELARDFDVKLQRNTDLLTLLARDGQAQGAADKARTLRDVFLERQDRTRQQKLKNTLTDQEKRLAQVERELKQSERDLEAFTLKNRIIDLDKEAQWYLEQLTSLQVLYEQAKVERSSVHLQAGNIDRIINDLKAKIEREKQENASMSNLGDINIQAQRLRDALHDDKQQRSGDALLRQKALEYERAKRLRERGLISQAELDKDQAAYESQKALTVDTPQTREWKNKIDALNAVAIPKGNTSTPSGTVLQQITLKSFDLQLDLVTQDQKVNRLLEAIANTQARLDQIPKLQQKFLALKREVETRASEKSNLESLLSETRRAYEAKGNDFTIATEPVTPVAPFESSRRKVFLVTAVVLGGLSVLGVLALCLLDERVITPKELSLALGGASVGVRYTSPSPLDGAFLARQLRRQLHESKASVAVLSAHPGAGKSRLLADLAQAWLEQGEQVAYLDLQRCAQGSGELPAFPSPPPTNPWNPSGSGPVNSARLNSGEFSQWLSQVQQWASLILLEAPAADMGVNADLLAARCSNVLIVAASGQTDKGSLRALQQRLKAEGAERIQGVLTGAGPWLRRWAKS